MLAATLAALLLVVPPSWAAAVIELTWSDLMPPESAPPAPPPTLHDLSQLADALASESGPAAVQQSPAAPTVPALDGVAVKLPGYIVPLDVTEEGRVVEFLLVPYFGACIHVPPPPSNQIVHIKSELGVLVDALYQPFWVEGPLKIEASSSELAEAGYTMNADKIYVYEVPEG
ncbi:MAG: DUF3299 domain-containing protein [Pseudomonadota bacterium]